MACHHPRLLAILIDKHFCTDYIGNMTQLTLETFDKILKERLDKGFEEQAILINRAFQAQKDYFEKRLDTIEQELKALSAKLSTHFDLSDKRYLELKRRDLVIGRWLKQIADKTGVEIDLAELEKF